MNDELLIRFIEKKSTVEEAREVLRWIEADEEHKAYFCQLQSVCASVDINYSSHINKVEPEDLQSIMKKVSQKHFRLAVSISTAVSAVAAILFFLFFPFSNKQVEVYDYEKALASITEQKEITIIVHENKQIKLQDSSVVVAYNKKGQILINDTATVTEEKDEKNNLNTIYVPYGKRSTLILADGTKVYLNSGSSMVYPAEFTGDIREVYLDGEAYFEVEKDKGRRFVVRTAYKAVEVLGTKFNVSIDKSLNRFETVLVTGKIALEGNTGTVTLSPNQYYGLSPETGLEELKNVDPQDYVSWINGKLKFQKEPLYKVLYKLEKVYNIEITLLKTQYKEYLISGNLDMRNTAAETLDVVMRILTPEYTPDNQIFYKIKIK